MRRTQKDRDEDLALGREFERKDAEIERLRSVLKPFADYAEYVAANHPGWDHDAFRFTLPSDNAKHVVTLKLFRDAFRALSTSDQTVKP